MSADPPATPVFVYGTLRPGSANPHAAFLTARCRPLGTARLKARLYRVGAHFAAVPDAHSRVTGEVLLLPPAGAGGILESLDRYEGIGAGLPGPPSYRREKVTVLLAGGEPLECWTWLYCRDVQGLAEVSGGDALSGKSTV